MQFMPLLLLCLLSCQLRQVFSYSQGAPASACQSLTPAHGVEPQTSDPPYSIIISSDSVNGTQPLEVVLKANQGKSFKGFILQARNAETKELLGAFSFQAEGGLPSSIEHMECDEGRNSAVTHTNNKPKTDVKVTWESSGYYEGNVIFNGTFVESKSVFWVGVMSQEVRVTKSKDPTSTVTPTSTNVPTTLPTTPKSGATSLLIPNKGVQFLMSILTISFFTNQMDLHLH